MSDVRRLTPAAERELLAAAYNGGVTDSTLRWGPREQLLETGLAMSLLRDADGANVVLWELRLTGAGWEYARRLGCAGVDVLEAAERIVEEAARNWGPASGLRSEG